MNAARVRVRFRWTLEVLAALAIGFFLFGSLTGMIVVSCGANVTHMDALVAALLAQPAAAAVGYKELESRFGVVRWRLVVPAFVVSVFAVVLLLFAFLG